jgi:diadenosine tetraphosphate (Ap4A) HIT family hydrolase
MNCPFCDYDPSRVVGEADFAIAILDAFPISEGHTLVVPRQHVGCLFELPSAEQEDLWKLVSCVRESLKNRLHPDGFNVGLNDGIAAGQTVGHAHIHVIPRFSGDVTDPRGGVRWVIPTKANYWQ